MGDTGIGPRVVGGHYHSFYWGERYEVLDIVRAGTRWAMTVRWGDGRTTTHCTPWDQRDRVFSPAV